MFLKYSGADDERWIGAAASRKGSSKPFWIGVLMVCSSCSLVSAQLGASVEECQRLKIPQPLPWTTSGVWDVEGRRLMLADEGRAEIMYLSTEDMEEKKTEYLWGTKAFDQLSGSEPFEFDHISVLKLGVGGDLFVKDNGRNIIAKLDDKSFVNSVVPIEKPFAREGDVLERLLAVDAWQPMNQGFVAFGDIQFPEEKGPGKERYGSAFVHFDETGIRAIYTEPIPATANERNFYLDVTFPYLATLDGESAYVLRMSGKPTLERLELNASSLADDRHEPLGTEVVAGTLPNGFSEIPVLARNPDYIAHREGPRQATEFYQTYEKSAMPRGIYAWNKRLFLLGKSAISADRQATDWWLIELDPEDGSEKARYWLPTRAANLTLIGGETTIALIEKQAVEGVSLYHGPYMETSSMVLFPWRWLSEPDTSPLRRPSADLHRPDLDCEAIGSTREVD